MVQSEMFATRALNQALLFSLCYRLEFEIIFPHFSQCFVTYLVLRILTRHTTCFMCQVHDTHLSAQRTTERLNLNCLDISSAHNVVV